MDRQEKYDLMEYLKEAHQNLFDGISELEKSLGDMTQGKLWDKICELDNVAVSSVSHLIGDYHFGWLDWFIYENNWGEKELAAKPPHGRLRPIKTIDDLLDLIEETELHKDVEDKIRNKLYPPQSNN